MESKVLQINEHVSQLHFVQTFCDELMKTRHYQKIGYEGLFALVAKANSLNVNAFDAVNGGLYYVQGKVEMSAAMMNYLIRQNGHSIQKDPKSDDSICILHGKRKDNDDTWTASFSVKDAMKAGIFNERGPWGKYTSDMLFARALSRLARQLFPDVIKGCYVEGEIAQAREAEKFDHKNEIEVKVTPKVSKKIETAEPMPEGVEVITPEEHKTLVKILKTCGNDFSNEISAKVKDLYPNINGWKELPAEVYKEILSEAEKFLLNTKEVVNA